MILNQPVNRGLKNSANFDSVFRSNFSNNITVMEGYRTYEINLILFIVVMEDISLEKLCKTTS